jgi:hypothetical protein
MLAATEGFILIRMMSSGRTTLRLALSLAPEHVEGGVGENYDPQVL